MSKLHHYQRRLANFYRAARELASRRAKKNKNIFALLGDNLLLSSISDDYDNNDKGTQIYVPKEVDLHVKARFLWLPSLFIAP